MMSVVDSVLQEFDPEERSKRPSVIHRATQVIDAFLIGGERLSLEEIVVMTGLPRSTAFRILNQLVDLKWLEHDSPGYRLGERARQMATHQDDRIAVRAAAAGHLNHLQLTTGTVVHLVVREGDQVLYLDKFGGPAAGSVPSHVGAKVPAARTVAGRALLACMSPELVDKLVNPSRDGAGIPIRLHRDLDRIRRRNRVAYAPARDCPLGISAVAAVVTGPTRPVAAISAAGRDRASLDAIAPMVADAARQISRDLTRALSGSHATASHSYSA